jgi:hypothetical protein
VEIIVEDGSNVPDANSYVDVDELVAYAADRKITIPTDEDDQKVLLINAMDYLATFNGRWIGRPTYRDQALPFPRTYGRYDLGVPSDLKTAQIVSAITSINTPLMPVQSGTQRMATRKTVGPITVQYQNAGSNYGYPVVPQLQALLRGLTSSSGGQLPVFRA